ncbi:type II toxin-antitoxin system HicB family antitoxin [Heliophilum fasciatum]|nr:toxin-antitoxin system HicB family antitoxin [Heliophilum fasciatum]MCW2278585.1 putative RNase H-like HicB family nuclease [Heliophilum fasciatum]
MALPYTFEIQHIRDESGRYFFGKVAELDGCQSNGNTLEELHENLREAMEGWIEVKLEHGDEIPEPLTDEGYSGKLVVRIPKSLHRRLAKEAQRDGVSLNQFMLYKLSR